MEATSRGLELTRTEQPSDAQRLCRVMKNAAYIETVKLQRQIEQQNLEEFKIHASTIVDISEIWLWTNEVFCRFEDTTSVLIAVPKYAHHIDEWHDLIGPVLWWRDTTEEPPYVGTPHDKGFDETRQWWSPLDTPEIPESEKNE